jgi:hypothetical protein
MPSRKKTQGKKRRANKLSTTGAAGATRFDWEFWAKGGESMVTCDHGFGPGIPGQDSPAASVLNAFEKKAFEEMQRSEHGMQINDLIWSMFIGLEHVWNDDKQIQDVTDTFIRIGTNIMLDEGESWKRIIAAVASILELYDGSINCALLKAETKLRDLYGDYRAVVKFFAKRTKCNCLDAIYERSKKVSKMGKCRYCQITQERASLMVCSQCNLVQYCSTKCQKGESFGYFKRFSCHRKSNISLLHGHTQQPTGRLTKGTVEPNNCFVQRDRQTPILHLPNCLRSCISSTASINQVTLVEEFSR